MEKRVEPKPALFPVEDFYDRVKAGVRRTKPPTTIKALVELAGLNLNQYNGIKRIKHFPKADEVLVMAKALGTSVEYLVTGFSDAPAPRLAPIVRDLARLSDPQLSAVGEIVSAMAATAPERAESVS